MRSRGLALAGAAACLFTLWVAHGRAQSSTVTCTVTAANATQAAVQNAMNAAASGAVVCVPAGTATWTGTLTFPSTNKDITLAGAGIGATVISCGGVNCWAMTNASNQRMTGFEFNWSGTNDLFLTIHGPVTSGKAFRIDHNKFNAPNTTWSIIDVSGDGPVAKHPTGVIDNNTFVNFSIHFNGTNFSLADGNTQHVLWSQPTTLGDLVDVVYVEDNSFTSTRTSGFQNFADGNYAARWVWRFNTHNGHGTGLEIHSVQGPNRAVRRWEVYGNTWAKNGASFYPVIFMRGGTGVVFDNTASADYGTTMLLDNVRSMGDPGGGVGACNGTSNWDQNSAGLRGYACRDQIGRGADTTTWAPGQPFAETSLPAYFFNNLQTGNQFAVTLDADCGSPSCLATPNNSLHIVANRDYYIQGASFSGTSGVGRGPLASRPATCTMGVGYWATDSGEWNSKHAGPDGQLFKCTMTNTWTLYYTPGAYPHPMTVGGAPAPPAAPQNLRIIPN